MTTASDDMKDRHPEKRTRLDEIVEEEAKSGMWSIGPEGTPSHYLGVTMRRIAERAFLLAKDMAYGVADDVSNDPHFDTAARWHAGEIARHIRERIQPAPASAEEKRTTGLGTVNHSGFMGCRCMRAKDAEYPSSFWICGDDRKGERRKFQHHTDGYGFPCKCASPWNRRSGSDRRKPKVSYAHE